MSAPTVGNNVAAVLREHRLMYGTRKLPLQTVMLQELRNAANGDHKFTALRYFIRSTWPEFVSEWRVAPGKDLPSFTDTNLINPWLELMLQAFTNERYCVRRGDTVFRSIVLTGAGGCGKTHVAGLFTVAWWLADMQNSIATLTSTTKDMIGQRIWPVISHYWQTATDAERGETFLEQGVSGDKVDSSRIIRAIKGDDKHAITALAVAHGETQKAIHNLKGRHAPRMLLVIDEANGTPEAIFEVIPNMRKTCKDLTVIIIGNPGSRFDPHGRALTPRLGWSSYNERSRIWHTKAVPEWQLDEGVALRFDGWQSPNIKAGKTLYPYIYTCEDKANALATPGYVGTFNYWVMERGLHPPEGTACTVFSEQLFSRCLDDKEQSYLWDGEVFEIAFFDPAFTTGGDAAWLQFARMGRVGENFCIQLGDGFEIPISPEVEAFDVDYQLARRVQQECIVRRVAPHCFGIDASGGGRGTASILAAEWSPNIVYLTFGGSASELPSAQNDGRPGSQVYDRKVTELHFALRETLEAGQIRGFTRTAMSQGCCRLYEMKGKKYSIETKTDYKSRARSSPDELDSYCGLIHVAKQNGLVIQGKVTTTALREWHKAANDEAANTVSGVAKEASSDGGWAEAVEMDSSPVW